MSQVATRGKLPSRAIERPSIGDDGRRAAARRDLWWCSSSLSVLRSAFSIVGRFSSSLLLFSSFVASVFYDINQMDRMGGLRTKERRRKDGRAPSGIEGGRERAAQRSGRLMGRAKKGERGEGRKGMSIRAKSGSNRQRGRKRGNPFRADAFAKTIFPTNRVSRGNLGKISSMYVKEKRRKAGCVLVMMNFIFMCLLFISALRVSHRSSGKQLSSFRRRKSCWLSTVGRRRRSKSERGATTLSAGTTKLYCVFIQPTD